VLGPGRDPRGDVLNAGACEVNTCEAHILDDPGPCMGLPLYA